MAIAVPPFVGLNRADSAAREDYLAAAPGPGHRPMWVNAEALARRRVHAGSRRKRRTLRSPEEDDSDRRRRREDEEWNQAEDARLPSRRCAGGRSSATAAWPSRSRSRRTATSIRSS